MIIDNELIDILRIDCTGLNAKQSAFKQENHIDYLYMCLGIDIISSQSKYNGAIQQIDRHFAKLKANEAYKAFIKQHPEYVRTSIKHLNLTTRSYNCLRYYGINTIAKLLMCTEIDLFLMHNLGKVSMNDIIDKLHKYDGLQLLEGDFRNYV